MKVGCQKKLHGFGKNSFKAIEMSSVVAGPRRRRRHFGEKSKHGPYNAPRAATMTLVSANGVSYGIVGSVKAVLERGRSL